MEKQIGSWNKYNIDHKIIQCLQKNGYHNPTDVQRIVLSNSQYYNDFVIASQTGSGKTLAFGIPIMNDIVMNIKKYGKQDYLKGLVLVPTRELAIQIEKELEKIYNQKDIRVGSIVGGMSSQKQQRIIDQKVDVIVATPGRLMDLIQTRKDSYLDHLDQIDYLVLDEADRMVEMGHFREIDQILDKVFREKEKIKDEKVIKTFMDNTEDDFGEMFIKDNTGKKVKMNLEGVTMINDNKLGCEVEKIQKKNNQKRKVFLASATLMHTFRGGNKLKLKKLKTKDRMERQKKKKEEKENPQEKKIEETNLKMKALYQKIKFQGKPKIIDLTSQNIFPEHLQEYKTVCSEDTKALYLYQYITSHKDEQFIVFANSITYARKVTNILSTLKIECILIHSHLQQKQRLKKLDRFRKKEIKVLVATDVAARGVDIPKVENVIHYQVPDNIDTYIHRSGRTARIGTEGKAYVLIGPKDMSRYSILCKELKKDQGIESIELNIPNHAKIVQLIESALRLESSHHQLEKVKKSASWFKEHSQKADIDVDSDIEEELKDEEQQQNQKRKDYHKHRKQHSKLIERQQAINPKKSRKLFLSPSQIASYSAKYNI